MYITVCILYLEKNVKKEGGRERKREDFFSAATDITSYKLDSLKDPSCEPTSSTSLKQNRPRRHLPLVLLMSVRAQCLQIRDIAGGSSGCPCTSRTHFLLELSASFCPTALLPLFQISSHAPSGLSQTANWAALAALVEFKLHIVISVLYFH